VFFFFLFVFAGFAVGDSCHCDWLNKKAGTGTIVQKGGISRVLD